MRPKIKNYVKGNKILMNLIGWLVLLKFTFKRGGIYLGSIFIYHNINYYILKNKKDISIKIHGIDIFMPNHMKPIDGVIEIMYDKFYDKIKGYECILDIGGYIGESAIRLAQLNKKIIVYEAHPENYGYLLKNIKTFNNIYPNNLAVVGNLNKNMLFYGGSFNMSAGIDSGNLGSISLTPINVGCVNIIDVLGSNDFDGIKIDIEGSEYECMETIMKLGKNLFKKLKGGIIEFHFHDNEKRIDDTKRIIERIILNGYFVESYNSINNSAIKLEEIEKYEIIFIYFHKLSR